MSEWPDVNGWEKVSDFIFRLGVPGGWIYKWYVDVPMDSNPNWREKKYEGSYFVPHLGRVYHE